jgi:hypothetical protein
VRSSPDKFLVSVLQNPGAQEEAEFKLEFVFAKDSVRMRWVEGEELSYISTLTYDDFAMLIIGLNHDPSLLEHIRKEPF